MKTIVATVVLIASLAAHAQPGRATPAGYWEGKASAHEIPMKDPNKELTRSVEAEIWFTVTWDPRSRTGTLAGEADATYDAVLKVENLPKVTAPVPGGSVKFEPSVGGKIAGDNKRKFPIVGVIMIDENDKGSLYLRKVDDRPQGSQQQQLDAEARGAKSFDAPMNFVMRADPGVSGGISKGGGNINYSRGAISGGVGGASQEVQTGSEGPGVITQNIPMAPFSPFAPAGGTVTKRAGGPYVASYEEKAEKRTIKWTAKQMGGERREFALTPEMRRLIEEMVRELRAQRR